MADGGCKRTTWLISSEHSGASTDEWNESDAISFCAVGFLKGIEEKYPGMEHINFASPLTTPKDLMLEQFQIVAEEVMPHFRAGTVHAAAAK